jgi:hypothetical protein
MILFHAAPGAHHDPEVTQHGMPRDLRNAGSGFERPPVAQGHLSLRRLRPENARRAPSLRVTQSPTSYPAGRITTLPLPLFFAAYIAWSAALMIS